MSKTDDEKLIREVHQKKMDDYIMAGIRNCINEITEEEIERSIQRLRKKMKDEVGRVAVRISRQFHIGRNLQEIIITFKEEDVRKDKK